MTREENYCGNCGMDYNGMTVGQMREIDSRGRLCVACRQLLADAIEAGSTDDDEFSPVDK